jgi:serine/threonine protein phosphatase 1
MRYVIGDIHGCYKSLKTLLEEIVRLNKDDELYFVGDLIDRGPSAKEVIDYLLSLQEQGYHIYAVKGNHEEMLLDAYVYHTPDKYRLWMFNGAAETLSSYGIDSYRFDNEMVTKEIPDEHIDFMRKLPYYFDLEDYIIVHAGVNFRSSEPFEDKHSMVWCRDCHNDLALSGNRVIVHGHTPLPLEIINQMTSSKEATQINVDAGCVYRGYAGLGNLLALDIDHLHIYHTINIDF